MTVLVSPEFDPLTRTWFLAKPAVEAPTLRELLCKLPGGHYLDATYNLCGEPIPINKIPERDGESPQRAPFLICNHKKPTLAAPPSAEDMEGFAPRSVVAKRAMPKDGRMPERFRNSHAEVMKLASHRIEAVAVLYAQGVPFRQIGKKIGVKENTISMIVHRQRKRGDLRFKPRPGDERYHSRKSNAAAEKGTE